MNRYSSGRTTAIAFLALVVAACGGRRPPLPDLSGTLADVVVRAAFEGGGEPAAGPLLLDSVSFGRLGAAAGGAPFAAAELERLVARPFRAVDAGDVLVCPSREPCRTVDDAVYVEVWQAEPTSDGLEIVVNRVFNVRGLYVATRSVTHRIQLRSDNGTWRLTRLDRLPA